MSLRKAMLPLGVLTALGACTRKPQPVAAATIGGTGVSRAAFQWDSGHAVPTIVNVRWLASTVDLDVKAWSLLKETDSAQWCGGEIAWCHSIALAGWMGAVTPSRNADWSAHIAAQPGGFYPTVQPQFYHAVDPGCCDARDANLYVSLRTGALRFRATGAIGEVRVVNSRVTRYVAFLDNWSALKPAEATVVKGVAGVLQYGGADQPTQVVALTADPADSGLRVCCRLDSLELRPGLGTPHGGALDLTHASWGAPLPPITFWIWLRLLPDYDRPFIEVAVPVVADRIVMEKEILPPGLRLQRVLIAVDSMSHPRPDER